MKYFLFIVLFSGCGYGYSVQDRSVYSKNDYGKIVLPRYVCEHIKPVFLSDENIAICDTKEECTAICLKARTEKYE